MIINWFIGIPQNATVLGTTSNFTDFGRPDQGATAPPVSTNIFLPSALDGLSPSGPIGFNPSLS